MEIEPKTISNALAAIRCPGRGECEICGKLVNLLHWVLCPSCESTYAECLEWCPVCEEGRG